MATLVFEFVPMVALLVAAPDLPSSLSADDPFRCLVRSGRNPWLADRVAIGVAMAVIACVLACARFFFGTACDGSRGTPLDRWMALVHPRFGSRTSPP